MEGAPRKQGNELLHSPHRFAVTEPSSNGAAALCVLVGAAAVAVATAAA